ncbi:unnamed protein product [Mytilus coruscus]|uniref:Uncharacterized protein n=1 Tax=Mytilus coruscus TaxID=42192 RepID=A0A6J8A4A5_MYTCO|nr:unnamed protein product [Mytilus coruscus]
MELTKTFLIILSRILWCEGSYRYWSPDSVKDLWCPEYCYSEPTTIRMNHCCSCRAKTSWELYFTNASYHELDLEIFDVQFKRTKLFSDKNSTFFSFEFVAGKLENFPENYCEFNIVNIDVTSNKFSEVVNLNCLSNLDTLIIAKNILTHLSNYTFVGMDKLRVLDLSFNRIKTMDLNILTSNGVLNYNFEFNEFHGIDTSNILAPNKTMCGVVYRNNKVQDIEVTNNLNYKLEAGTVCNNVDFSGVNTSPNVLIGATHGIEMNQILKHVPCGTYIYRGTGFICDCEFVEFFELSFSDIMRVYNKTLSEYYCQTPKSLFNISINVVYSNQLLIDQMTCDIKDFCHSIESVCECTCISQPSQKRLIVDCSNQSCTDLPQMLPETKYGITLKMNRNNVQSLNAKDYFNRITLLDLTENPVKTISSDIATLSNNREFIVILYDHYLQTLPKSIQNLNPDMFRFGTKGIICDCGNQWIGEWRIFKKAQKMYPLVCSNYNSTLIEDMVGQINGCKDEALDNRHPSEDARQWLEKFEAWIVFNRWLENVDKTVSTMQLKLEGNALSWFQTLPNITKKSSGALFKGSFLISSSDMDARGTTLRTLIKFRETMTEFNRGLPASSRVLVIQKNPKDFKEAIQSAILAQESLAAFPTLDTGSNNIIHETLKEQEAIQLLTKSIQEMRLDSVGFYVIVKPSDKKVIITANDEHVETGTINVDLKVGDESSDVKFYLVPCLTPQLILGLDFLNHQGAVIGFNAKKFSFDPRRVLIAKSDITVPPKSEVVIAANMKGAQLPENVLGLVSESPSLASRRLLAQIQLHIRCFRKRQIKYLGHIVSSDGISPDPDKISAIKDYPIPKRLKDVRAFLGLSEPTGKFARWIALLQSYNMEILYRLRTTHGNADGMSHREYENATDQDMESHIDILPYGAVVEKLESVNMFPIAQLKVEQRKDKNFKNIIAFLESGELPGNASGEETY